MHDSLFLLSFGGHIEAQIFTLLLRNDNDKYVTPNNPTKTLLDTNISCRYTYSLITAQILHIMFYVKFSIQTY